MAVIQPASVTLQENTNVLLDGSQSTDADGDKFTYHWEAISGPSIVPDWSPDTPTLQFQSLPPGVYKFGLVVTDAHGVKSPMAEATVTVNKARDDRPHAMAGQCGGKGPGSFTVKLPLPSVQICGNFSTDDKGVKGRKKSNVLFAFSGILSYKWTREASDSEKTSSVTLSDPEKSTLTMTNIEPGTYTFHLTVTDTARQTDNTTLTVIVQSGEQRCIVLIASSSCFSSEDNLPPVPFAGLNQTKELAMLNSGHSVILNASSSTDDVNITSYKWKQLR